MSALVDCPASLEQKIISLINMYEAGPDHYHKKAKFVAIIVSHVFNKFASEFMAKHPGVFTPYRLSKTLDEWMRLVTDPRSVYEFPIQCKSQSNVDLLCKKFKQLLLALMTRGLKYYQKEDRENAQEELRKQAVARRKMKEKQKKEEIKQAKERQQMKEKKEHWPAANEREVESLARDERLLKREKEKKEKEEREAFWARRHQQEREDKERYEQIEKSRAGAKRKADETKPTMDAGVKKKPRQSKSDPNKPKPNKTCPQHPKDANMCSLVPVENLCKFCMKAKRKAAKK